MLAEGLPAAEGVIDLLGTDAQSRLVVVCTDRQGGAPASALAFARALGIRRWLTTEMPGWLQLVPDLEVGADTPIRLLLLLKDATGPVHSAIEALPAGWIEPVIYRPYSHRGDTFLLLEHVGSPPAPPAETAATDPQQIDPPAPLAREHATASAADAPPLPALRSGISEADFGRARHGRQAGKAAAEAVRPRFDVTGS